MFNPELAVRYEQVDATTAYIGHAALGSPENQPVWRIKRLVTSPDGDLELTIANGDGTFSHAWTDRAGLSYL